MVLVTDIASNLTCAIFNYEKVELIWRQKLIVVETSRSLVVSLWAPSSSPAGGAAPIGLMDAVVVPDAAAVAAAAPNSNK